MVPRFDNEGDGSATNPYGKIQLATEAAQPGDTVLLHTGRYDQEGIMRIHNSGTKTARITMQPAGDGPVTLSAVHPPEPCDAKGPTANRTLKLMQGADYWTIKGLRIEGGLWVSGNNYGIAKEWLEGQYRAGKWQERRALPGRGRNDPVAAENIYTALETKVRSQLPVGERLDPAEGVQILDNDISGRGFHAAMARRGALINNKIHDIECGTGPGAWISSYSDFWRVQRNEVSRVQGSQSHFMEEGIRMGGASSYGLVERNIVRDLPGEGRAFTTDVDPSWNTIRYNTARNVYMGFNDQMSGWGNKWYNNRGEGIRQNGIVFRGADSSLTEPSMNTTPRWADVRCNVIVRGAVDGLVIGAINQSQFVNNDFGGAPVRLGKHVPNYWVAKGNTWNGQAKLPPTVPPKPPAGACAGSGVSG